jgi:hypothetical protein
MKIHASPSPAPPARIAATLAAAVVAMLLALAAGIAGLLPLFFLLSAVWALLVGAAIWQTGWFWRFVAWSQPKDQQGRQVQKNTAIILAILAAVILIYSLAQL